jgi:hypothetical protein
MKLKLAIVPLLLILSACTGTKQLYGQADTPVQYAKAVLLHHNAIGEQIADLRSDAAVSESSKTKLLDGYRHTVCGASERATNVATSACREGAAQRLEAASRAYEALRTAQTEADLQAAVDALVGQLVTLISLVNEAK